MYLLRNLITSECLFRSILTKPTEKRMPLWPKDIFTSVWTNWLRPSKSNFCKVFRNLAYTVKTTSYCLQIALNRRLRSLDLTSRLRLPRL